MSTTQHEACPACGSDSNERDELIKAEREIERLTASLASAQAQPCDAGEICVGCSPRNADGSCPDALAREAADSVNETNSILADHYIRMTCGAQAQPSLTDEVRQLVKDIHDAISELAPVARYPDLTEAIDRLAAISTQAAQPASLTEVIRLAKEDSLYLHGIYEEMAQLAEVAGFVPKQPVQAQGVPEKPSQDGDTLEDNVRFLLDRCPYTVRSREGGGPEDLIGSLCITFTGMQARLQRDPMFMPKATAAPSPQQAEPLSGEQIRKALRPFYVTDNVWEMAKIEDTKTARAIEQACAEAWGVKLRGIKGAK